MLNYRKEIVIALIGAAIGMLVTLFMASANRMSEANQKIIVANSKQETVASVSELLLETGAQREKLRALFEEMKDQSDALRKTKEEADVIVKNLKDKVSIDDDQLVKLFKPFLDSEISRITNAKIEQVNTVPSGAIMLISKNNECPPNSIEVAGANLQLSKQSTTLLNRLEKITSDSTWDVSGYYDGRVFKTCLYN